MAKLTTLLFDVDGTLADTERDGHRPAFNQAFADKGLEWQWSEALYGELLAVTGGKERIRHYLTLHHPEALRDVHIDQLIVELHQTKTRHYTEMLAQGQIPLRMGVQRLLEEALSADMDMAVVTTTTEANVTALLTHTLGASSLSWFKLIAAGDIVPKKKPASDIYDYTLEKLGVSAAQCLAFEDSENGIKSSLGADIKTLITINDYTKDHDFTGAALVVDCLGEPGEDMNVISGQCPCAYVDLACARLLHAA